MADCIPREAVLALLERELERGKGARALFEMAERVMGIPSFDCVTGEREMNKPTNRPFIMRVENEQEFLSIKADPETSRKRKEMAEVFRKNQVNYGERETNESNIKDRK